jgi:hypothetical protein
MESQDHDAPEAGDDLTALFGQDVAPSPAAPPRPYAPVPSTAAFPLPAASPSGPLSADFPSAPVPASSASAFGQPPITPPAPTAPAAANPPFAPPPLVRTSPSTAPAFGGAMIVARRETAPVVAAPAPPSWTEPERIEAPVATVPDTTASRPAPLPTTPAAAATASGTATLPRSPEPSDAPFDPAGPLLPTTSPVEDVDEARLGRSTLVERILFVLAFVVPPVGLVGTIVASVLSDRRRGWVIGLLRAGIAVGIVFSVIAAGGAYAGYKVLRQQQAHAQTVAESAAFCAAFVKDPTLAGSDGGWPQPAASIPDSITAMQGFVDRWTALAKVAPAGVQAGVQSVATTGTGIIGSVNVQRTVDDASNRQLVQSTVASSGVADWRAEYCG